MTDDELRRLFAETHQYIDVKTTETRQYIDLKTAETLERVDAKTVEMRRHFDVTTEATRHEMQLITEAVMQVDAKLDREAADIRHEMRSGFAETQAMIKFSHAELDRRMRLLEQGLADLQARVERLESTPH